MRTVLHRGIAAINRRQQSRFENVQSGFGDDRKIGKENRRRKNSRRGKRNLFARGCGTIEKMRRESNLGRRIVAARRKYTIENPRIDWIVASSLWLDRIGAQRRRYTFLFFANCFASRIAAIMLEGF